MANQWFKFYGGEYLSDPKIERLRPIERSCWLTILCLASMGDGGLIQFLTVESLLNKSGIQYDPYHPEEWENALSVLTKFQNMKMIKLNENGDIEIINWEKRQEHNLTVAERVAKHRENKQSNKNVTMNVTNVTIEENRIEENRIEENRIEENIYNTGAETLPEGIDSDSWIKWEKHRKEIRKKITPSTKKLQLKFLVANLKDHKEIINQSISNGWTGLFELKRNYKPNNTVPSTPNKYDKYN